MNLGGGDCGRRFGFRRPSGIRTNGSLIGNGFSGGIKSSSDDIPGNMTIRKARSERTPLGLEITDERIRQSAEMELLAHAERTLHCFDVASDMVVRQQLSKDSNG